MCFAALLFHGFQSDAWVGKEDGFSAIRWNSPAFAFILNQNDSEDKSVFRCNPAKLWL